MPEFLQFDASTVALLVRSSLRITAALFLVGYAGAALHRGWPNRITARGAALAPWAMLAVPFGQAAHYTFILWLHSVREVDALALRPAAAITLGVAVWLIMWLVGIGARWPESGLRRLRVNAWAPHLLWAIFVYAYLPRITRDPLHAGITLLFFAALAVRLAYREKAAAMRAASA